jgi:hypothetical protein
LSNAASPKLSTISPPIRAPSAMNARCNR